MNVLTTKPAYLWALGITAVLAVWALAAPAPESNPAVAEVQRELRPASSGESRPSISRTVAMAESSASSEIGSRTDITEAQVDIFADRRRPPTAETSTVPPALPAAPLELIGPPLPPPPPPLSVQFAGRFRTPDGRTVVYLRDGERTAAVKVGDIVSSGFQIVAMLGDGQRVLTQDDLDSRIAALRFLYPPLRHTEILTLPPEAAAP